MKKFAWIFVFLLALTGCSGKPSDSEMEKMFIAAFLQEGRDKVFEIQDFQKTAIVDKDDKTFVADIKYNIKFKMSSEDMTRNLPTVGAPVVLAVAVKYGQVKAGDIKESTSKVTYIKTDKGWAIQQVE